VREIARVGGKPKVVSQIYIGSPERVAGLVAGSEEAAVRLKVEEFGALWLAHQISQDVDLVNLHSALSRVTFPEYFWSPFL
jgi:hypothetical protein